jgi:N-methylhydantoinase B
MLDSIDPVRLEVIKNRLTSLTEEMGAVLMRTAFSPNIKERRDFSCALFDAQGAMLAQAAHIPVHLGSMPLSVAAALEFGELQPGDMLLLNDPYRGGTHLPDLTLVMPVFGAEPHPVFYLANRAHHADVGGMTAGSLPLSSDIFQEGLRIPPVRILKQDEIDRDLLQLILANVRTPIEREGDLTAQIAANRVGERRLLELFAQFGLELLQVYGNRLLNYGEQMMSEVIAAIPDGEYCFSDQLDDDGAGRQGITIAVKLTVAGRSALVDLSSSDGQVPGCVNAVRAITLSAVYYAFRLLAEETIFYNAGCMRPIEVLTRPGSIVDARFPAAVAGGNVETSQRVVDVILGALAEALPGKIPAASCGTMNNLTIGGYDPRRERLFAYYETIAGGSGGGPQGPGASGLQSHMTNTLNTPVEALEHAYPLRIERYQLRKGSGGAGQARGGEGVVKAFRLLADARVTLLTDRRISAPYGLNGGSPGSVGRNLRISGSECEELPGKCSIQAVVDDVIVIETPGGGGWGQ